MKRPLPNGIQRTVIHWRMLEYGFKRSYRRQSRSTAIGRTFGWLLVLMTLQQYTRAFLLQSHSYPRIRHALPNVLAPVTAAVSTSPDSFQSASPEHPSTSAAGEGLSRFHQSILSRTVERQRFVTGRYPLTVTIRENPTRKWLRLGQSNGDSVATTEIFVNNTTTMRSLASLDRFHWLDDKERQTLLDSYAMVSLEFIAEIHIERPGYLHLLRCDGAGSSAATQRSLRDVLPFKRPAAILKELEDDLTKLYRDRLWVTGFSLTGRQGFVKSIETNDGFIGSVNPRTASSVLWPNEVTSVPSQLLQDSSQMKNPGVPRAFRRDGLYQDALLVSDGFLVPGKDHGGLYIVKNPGNPQTEWTMSLTDNSGRWFYHRAVWADLTGDGRQSILTARCKVSTNIGNKNDGVTSGISKKGELVWLECPQPASIDPTTGTPLETDGTQFDPFSSRHLPWKTRVLATGPDVMFCVADLDITDDTIEVISSQFFSKSVALHSIRRGPEPKVCFTRSIDDRCGTAFSSILVDLDCNAVGTKKDAQASKQDRCVINSGSSFESLSRGDCFSHLLVTSHECSYVEPGEMPSSSSADGSALWTPADDTDGGSLFAYRVPEGKGSWKTNPWLRTTVATGFKVHGQINNMINPGAPGFVYSFHAKKDDAYSGKRPMIAIAGDCAEAAYIYRPDNIVDTRSEISADPSTQYKLMVEIQCGSTVGSIGISYDDFTTAEQESGYAKLYIPCYENDKVFVFALGSGEEEKEIW
jgi:hypothetical protein